MTSTIQIFLAAVPRMASDILRGWLRGVSDMEVADDTGSLDEIPRVLRNPGVDALILGVEGESLPPGVEEMTRPFPEVKLLGLSDDGSEAFIFEWHAVGRSLGAASPELLVRALREPDGEAASNVASSAPVDGDHDPVTER